jgi:hypothetical protein
MCGLVGVVLKGKRGFISKEENSFLEMLYIDALRGKDSTGLIGVEKDNAFHIAKEASEASLFLPQWTNSQAAKDVYKEGKAYIGHNRKKTVGDIKDETAHPFVINDRFAMVHNGTLNNHKQLADTEVDSKALAIVLEEAFGKEDYKTALEETLGKVYGAYAVAIYDQRTHKVHLLRNSDRPLCLITTDDAWYWCSEVYMGLSALARNGYDSTKWKVESVEPMKLHTFDLDAGTLSTEVLVKKYPSSRPVPTVHDTLTRIGTKIVPRSTAGMGVRPSKKEFKEFKRKWIGKKTSFFVNDYIEEDFPKKWADYETFDILIMGTHEEIKYKHCFYASIDTLDHKDLNDEDDVLEQLWVGDIEDMEDLGIGGIRIYVGNAQRVAPSVPPKSEPAVQKAHPLASASMVSEFVDWENQLKGMDNWAIAKWFHGNFWKGETWQTMAVRRIAHERGIDLTAQASKPTPPWDDDKDKAYWDVIHQCEDKGITVNEKIISGRKCLVTQEGEILYESATVNH